MQYRFSIIVPARNAQKTMEKCIRSLLDQQYPKQKYEIIVVDNNSSDNTRNVLEAYASSIVILTEPKQGSYAARNRGIKAAKGEVIAFIDSDCIADPFWVHHLNGAFHDKRCKIAGGSMEAYYPKTTLERYCCVFCHRQDKSLKSSTPYLASANMSIRKEYAQKLFHESLKSGGDVEFCLRLIKKEHEMVLVKQAIVRHIYDKSLFKFIRKNFLYGKWNSVLRSRYSICVNMKLLSYGETLASHGLAFLFLRAIQDLSYWGGLCYAKCFFQKAMKNP